MSDPRDERPEDREDEVDEAQAEIDADLDADEDVTGDDAADADADAATEQVPAFLTEPPEEPEPADVAEADADPEATAVLPPVPADEPEADAEATAVMDAVPAAAPATGPEQAVATDEVAESEEKRRVHWGRWALMFVLIALVGGYFAAAVYASGRIAAGTTVQGVDIGGMTRDEAVEALQPTVKELNNAPVAITTDDAEATIVPKDSGMAAGAGATVDELLRFSLAPFDLLRSFTGAEREAPLVTVVDVDALAEAIDATREELEVDGQDAAVEITATGASSVASVDGVAIDAEATAEGLGDAWPVDTYPAVTDLKPAAIGTEDADAFVSELNSEVLAGDVRMTGENGPATVTAEQLTRFGSVEDVDGALTLVIDGPSLAAELESADPGLVSAPTSASFHFTSSHQLRTTKSQPGRAIDGGALGEAVVAAASSVEREGELPYRNTKATVTSGDLGVKDLTTKVASFDTPLTDEPVRTQNLVRGAEKVTGVVVKPDETFSLLDSLAPITEAGGYQAAHIIVDGFLTNGIGGGLSQMATTVYNAAYFAGLEDVEHRPHTKWFTRYPAGREATIFVGSLDLRFKNNTPYALVMSSYVTGGRLYVDIWSTPYYEVKTYASEKTNFVQPKKVESDRSTCLDTPMGNPGFTITNRREVFLDGDLVDESSYTWTYQPDNGVTCTN
ncbi:VanW family protein [Demequina sp. SYSU T00192]|uniref:VanW family protein n=1 Tax=Demequina litoralis TaxID=3051660 RepID=A0ABT8G9L9_9MICO|nr:VanW family protein [Demequina sp. SYSU T00192]MDN4475659.1 VanW family protein [Demequina sp. SYSU T00192]